MTWKTPPISTHPHPGGPSHQRLTGDPGSRPAPGRSPGTRRCRERQWVSALRPPPPGHPSPPPGWKAAIVGCQLPEGTPGGGHKPADPVLTTRRSRWRCSSGRRSGQGSCGTGGTSVREGVQQLMSPRDSPPQGTRGQAPPLVWGKAKEGPPTHTKVNTAMIPTVTSSCREMMA